jgi:hypothetical protein
MMRSLLIGLWTCAVALGATYGGAQLKQRASVTAAADHAPKLEVKKVKPITVPIIAAGTLKGYVSAEFSFVTEAGDKHGGALDPEIFLMDEAFRLIYSDNALDFEHIDKIDLSVLTKRITEKVNEHAGVTRIKETLVKNFAFTAKEDLPR